MLYLEDTGAGSRQWRGRFIVLIAVGTMSEALAFGLGLLGIGLVRLLQPNTIHTAAASNDVQMLLKFLRQGVNPEEWNAAGDTPLHIAARNGNIEIIKELLYFNPALIRKLNRRNNTALIEAVKAKAHSAISVLIKYDYEQVEQAILKCVETDVNKELLKWLPKGGKDLLCKSARIGDIVMMRKILMCGLSPNVWSEGLTALHHAAFSGKANSVQVLLQYNANVSSRNHKGNTPLHHAAMGGSIQCARLLIYANARRCEKNESGRIPYDYAKSEHMRQLLQPPECSIL